MMIVDLIKENELPVYDSLSSLLPLVSPTHGIMQQLKRVAHFSDEPKPYKYVGIVGSTRGISDGIDYATKGSGYSFFSQEEALLKCLGETIERYCLKVYKKADFIWSSYEKIKEKALDPCKVVSFSGDQRKKKSFRRFNYDHSSPFNWVKGYSLMSNRSMWIPAQLVYVSYIREPEEKIIQFLLSTGAAGGSCLSGALCRGIYEIIERDSFMIYWLNKIIRGRIDLHKLNDEKVKKLLKVCNRYKLNLYTFDITSDLQVPSFLTIVVDRSGIGMAVSAGLKSHLGFQIALVGSIEEAMNSRTWIRKEVEDNPRLLKKVNIGEITSLKDRGVYWFPKERIKHLNYLLNADEISLKNHNNIQHISSGTQLAKLIEIFSRNKYEVIFVDISTPKVRELGYKIVKVLVPQLHPLSLNEKYPYLGGKRLNEVPKILGLAKGVSKKEINQIPHPFL